MYKSIAPQCCNHNSRSKVRSECKHVIIPAHAHSHRMNDCTEYAANQKCQYNAFPSKKQTCRRHKLNITAAKTVSTDYKSSGIQSNEHKYTYSKKSDYVFPQSHRIINYRLYKTKHSDCNIKTKRNLICTPVNNSYCQQNSEQKAS